MRAIIKKELCAFFDGVRGWILVAVLLFAEGITFVISNLSMGTSTLSGMLEMMPLVLILLLPFFCVRLTAASRVDGEELWLSTLPLPTWKIWIGKYAALLMTFLLSSLPLFFMPLIMSLYGTVRMGLLYLSILGYLLMGAALLAMLLCVASAAGRGRYGVGCGVFLAIVLYFIGLLVPELPPLPWLSLVLLAVLFLAVGLALALLSRRPLWGVGAAAIGILPSVTWFLIRPDAFGDLFARLVEKLDLFAYMSDFLYGRLDLGGILFDVCFTAFFLFLTVALAEGRRRA